MPNSLMDFQSDLMGMNSLKEEAQENKVEFKVTPYTIVNFTSKPLKIKRVFQTISKKVPNQSEEEQKENEGKWGSNNFMHIPKEYSVKPGEQIDYEVDYEEEARQLMRISKDELIRRHDFVKVVFEMKHNLYSVITGVNLRDNKHYRHDFEDSGVDYIAYGVTFENMRKILTFRNPYTIQNMTCFNYQLKLIGHTSERIVPLKPGQCYPVSVEDMNRRFSICNASNSSNEWSNPIKILTVIDRLPKNTTTYLYHGKQFSIVIKEKTAFAKTYSINIKSPVIMKNALPCNLRIKTNVIKEAIKSKKKDQKEAETDFLYEEEIFVIEKGSKMMFYNFNLKETIFFYFTLDLDPLMSDDDKGLQSFGWAEALIKNTEFKKTTKLFQIQDVATSQTLDVYLKMRNAKDSGVLITFFVQNIIINNTDQQLRIYYDKKVAAAGQSSLENSVVLVSDKSKVMACIEEEGQQSFSNYF
mmetsp:Transcript_43263/g.41637  ORF Transcript_43263/g.41637 Transcript_43263/m.41637 type:complete len:470 (+) Transcript_43263:964-2373(+)